MRTAPARAPSPAWMLAALLLLPATARGTIFKYVDPRTHVASYTNFRPADHRARELVIAPARTRRAERTAPARAPLLGIDDFPRIAPARQRELDAGRRNIIGDELKAEELLLRQAQGGAGGAEALARHRGNVEALRRELARLP